LAERLAELPPNYRFGAVLALLGVTFIFMASGLTGNWYRVVTVGLQGATLLAAMLASGVSRHLIRIVLIITVVGFVAAIASVIVDQTHDGDGAMFALSLLLVGAAPVVIIRSMWRRREVDLQTILGALCIYVLIGMMMAFLYGAISYLSPGAFFAQTKNPNSSDFLYFSFVTLTTVGYGDLTVAGGIGRPVAVIEAMLGQVYLVTVVALLVGRMQPFRSSEPAPNPTPTGPSAD